MSPDLTFFICFAWFNFRSEVQYSKKLNEKKGNIQIQFCLHNVSASDIFKISSGGFFSALSIL